MSQPRMPDPALEALLAEEEELERLFRCRKYLNNLQGEVQGVFWTFESMWWAHR